MNNSTDPVEQYYVTRIPDDAQVVYSGISYTIFQWQQELFDKSITTYEMAKAPDGVSIIAIIDDKLVMLEEEQPRKPKHWAVPGGHIEKDETPLAAAQREMLEETGMVFRDWKLVAVEPIGNYRLEWYVFRFVASHLLERRLPRPEASERIVCHEVGITQAHDYADKNHFAAPSIIMPAQTVDDIIQLPEVRPQSAQ